MLEIKYKSYYYENGRTMINAVIPTNGIELAVEPIDLCEELWISKAYANPMGLIMTYDVCVKRADGTISEYDDIGNCYFDFCVDFMELEREYDDDSNVYSELFAELLNDLKSKAEIIKMAMHYERCMNSKAYASDIVGRIKDFMVADREKFYGDRGCCEYEVWGMAGNEANGADYHIDCCFEWFNYNAISSTAKYIGIIGVEVLEAFLKYTYPDKKHSDLIELLIAKGYIAVVRNDDVEATRLHLKHTIYGNGDSYLIIEPRDNCA